MSVAKRNVRSNPRKAFVLYQRAYDICEPALERRVSRKVPNVPLDQGGDRLGQALARVVLESPDSGGGFWVDSCLVGIGYEALEALHKLRRQCESYTDRERIDSAAGRVLPRLRKMKDEEEKRESRGMGLKERVIRLLSKVEEKKLERFLKAFFTVVIIGGSSVAAAFLAFLVFRLFQAPVLFWRVLLANVAALAVWAVIHLVILFVMSAVLLRSKPRAEPTLLQGYLSAAVSGICAVVVAALIGGWAGGVSLLMLAAIQFLLSKSARTGDE